MDEKEYFDSIMTPEEKAAAATNAQNDPGIRAHDMFHMHADQAMFHALSLSKYLTETRGRGLPVDPATVALHHSMMSASQMQAELHQANYYSNSGQTLIPDNHADTEEVKCNLCGKDISAVFIDR